MPILLQIQTNFKKGKREKMLHIKIKIVNEKMNKLLLRVILRQCLKQYIRLIIKLVTK